MAHTPGDGDFGGDSVAQHRASGRAQHDGLYSSDFGPDRSKFSTLTIRVNVLKKLYSRRRESYEGEKFGKWRGARKWSSLHKEGSGDRGD